MRTIKFRAFILGKMYDVKAIDFDGENGITITTDGGFYNISHGTKDEHGHLMQYTGLKDKNGVDIYEADIVEFEYNNAKMIKEVYWDNEWNCWKVYINGGNIHTLNSHSMGYLIPTVIGNIHEGEKNE